MRRSKINGSLAIAEVFGGPELFIQVNRSIVQKFGVQDAYTIACLQKYLQYNTQKDKMDMERAGMYHMNIDAFCDIACVSKHDAVEMLSRLVNLQEQTLDHDNGIGSIDFGLMDGVYVYTVYDPCEDFAVNE